MKKIKCLNAALLASLAWGLFGCASAPIHHYTLVPPLAASGATGAPASYAIHVLPVRIPEPLNRLALVVRQGPGEVAVVNTERWAGPLEDEIALALSQNLSQRLGANDAAELGAASTGPVLNIQVDIRRLDGWLGHRVDLEATWSVYGAGAKTPRALCRSVIAQPSQGSYEQLVADYQRALDQLSAQIAAAVQLAATGEPVHCPAAR